MCIRYETVTIKDQDKAYTEQLLTELSRQAFAFFIIAFGLLFSQNTWEILQLGSLVENCVCS